MQQRIRTFKPEALKHEGLFELEQSSGLPIRLAWLGLFTISDREGRFKWRPRTLKSMCLPHDALDFGRVLDELNKAGFVVRYRCGDDWYGWIPTFTDHQFINNREQPSTLPSVDEASEVQRFDAIPTRQSRLPDAVQGEQNRTEQNGTEQNVESSAPPRVAEPASPVLVTFVTIGKGAKSWDFTEAYRADLQEAYPAVDVLAEVRKARAWVDADANRRKTAVGMKKFLIGWMNRTMERGGTSRSTPGAPAPATTVERERIDRKLRAWGFCRHSPQCTSTGECRAKLLSEMRGEEAVPA